MARAAKVQLIFGVQGAQIGDALVLQIPRLHRRYVFFSGAVTSLASHAGDKLIELRERVAGNICGVTAKAVADIGGLHFSARRRQQRGGRRCLRSAERDIQIIDRAVETDAAFVELARVLKHISLAEFAMSESPKNWRFNCRGAVAHGIKATPFATSDVVMIYAAGKLQLLVPLQNRACGAGVKRLRHAGVFMTGRFVCMALGASIVSQKLSALLNGLYLCCALRIPVQRTLA